MRGHVSNVSSRLATRARLLYARSGDATRARRVIIPTGPSARSHEGRTGTDTFPLPRPMDIVSWTFRRKNAPTESGGSYYTDRSQRSTRREVRPPTIARYGPYLYRATVPFGIRPSSARFGDQISVDRLNPPVRASRAHPFCSERFHVLLNSLFKVLCNFPSRYLFAIGLVEVFSLRWSLPPA